MKLVKRKAYWGLLSAAMVAAAALLLVRPTYSHYANTTYWNTVLSPTVTTVTSDCLTQDGQTILLNDLTLELDEDGEAASTAIPISFNAPVGTEGTLKYSVSGETAAVLSVELPDTIAGGATTAVLLLTPILTVHAPTEAEILVTWTVGDAVRTGTFRVTVPEVTQEDLPAEETDEPVESDEVSDGQTEETDAEAQSDEPVATVAEPVALTTVEDSRISLNGVTAFDLAALLPIQPETAESGLSLELGLQGEDGALAALPAFTRYSVDGGLSYTLLYHGGTIPLAEMDGGGFPLVLLDLSGTGVTEGTTLTLMTQRESDGQLLQSVWSTTATKLLPADSANNPKVLTRSGAAVYTLPAAWSGAESNNSISVTYAVTMLTETVITDETTGVSRREAEYRTVALDGTDGLTAAVTSDETGASTTLTIRRADGSLPPAGTYHLTLRWSFGGICYARTDHTFFVNYAVDALAETGGTEQ